MSAGHARLGKGEGGDHPDGVQRDEVVGVGPEGDDQEHGRGRQDQDAVGVDQAVPALAQLAGQDGVVSGEGGQQREAGERGVGRQDQDQQGGHLDGDEGGRVGEHVAGQLGDQGGVAVGGGAGVEAGGQKGDADEQEGHDGGHADQGGAGVAGL